MPSRDGSGVVALCDLARQVRGGIAVMAAEETLPNQGLLGRCCDVLTLDQGGIPTTAQEAGRADLLDRGGNQWCRI